MFQLKTFFFLLLTGGCGLLFAQTPALATTADAVVVTGTKAPRKLSLSPEAVTVIDSAQIAQASDLGQLLNEQAGIVVNGAYANPGKDRSIFLRNAGNAFTVILIDGQPLLDPSSLGGAVDLRLLALDGIERIEVLRGAGSLLYGSDAVAGVINLITRRDGPSATAPSRPAVHLRAAAQSVGAFEAGASVSGQSEKLDYRLGLDYFTVDGLSEAEAPADATEAFNNDAAQRQTLTASLAYRPSEKLTIRPALRLAEFTGDYDGGSFQDADNDYENKLFLPSLAVDYAGESSRLGARYSYAKTDRVFNSTFGASDFNGRNQQGELFGTFSLSQKTQLTTGLQLRQEALDLPEDAPRDIDAATTLSAYLSGSSQLGKTILLEGGLRLNNHSNYGTQFNYSAAAALTIAEGLTGRLSVASAFQNPTLDQLGGPFGANPDLEPQTAVSLEAGASYANTDGGLRIDLNAFRRTTQELIIFDFAAGYQNRDEQVDNGVELSLATPLTEGLSLRGNLTYVQGELRLNDGSETAQDEFFRRPRTTGFVGLTYTGTERLTARISGNYTGARPDIWFDANFAATTVDLDPYFLLNAYAEYRLLAAENLKLFVDLTNLTNTEFVEVTGFTTLGFVARGGVAYRF